MLDVHILTLPSTPREQLGQCIESVTEAASVAGFPVSVQVLRGIIGHIGEGRAKGYAKGIFPYVTCVDDDDYLLPHAFSQMREILFSDKYSAIATPEFILRNGHQEKGKMRHHLIAYRRSCVIDHNTWVCCGDVKQINSVPAEEWTDLPSEAYVHRVYLSRARLMRRANPDEWVEAYA